MSSFPHARVLVTADGGDPAAVTDLAAYRAKRDAWQAEEATGRLRFERLRVEAREHIVALVAGGVL